MDAHTTYIENIAKPGFAEAVGARQEAILAGGCDDIEAAFEKAVAEIAAETE